MYIYLVYYFILFLQRIVRELNHPNICGYRGFCVAAPCLSLVFEFLDNGTLGDRLRNRRRHSIAAPTSSHHPPLPPAGGGGGSATGSANNEQGVVQTCTSGGGNGVAGCGCWAGACTAGGAGGGVGAGAEVRCRPADVAQGLGLLPPPRQLQPADLFRIVEDVVGGMLYLHEVRQEKPLSSFPCVRIRSTVYRNFNRGPVFVLFWFYFAFSSFLSALRIL